METEIRKYKLHAWEFVTGNIKSYTMETLHICYVSLMGHLPSRWALQQALSYPHPGAPLSDGKGRTHSVQVMRLTWGTKPSGQSQSKTGKLWSHLCNSIMKEFGARDKLVVANDMWQEGEGVQRIFEDGLYWPQPGFPRLHVWWRELHIHTHNHNHTHTHTQIQLHGIACELAAFTWFPSSATGMDLPHSVDFPPSESALITKIVARMIIRATKELFSLQLSAHLLCAQHSPKRSTRKRMILDLPPRCSLFMNYLPTLFFIVNTILYSAFILKVDLTKKPSMGFPSKTGLLLPVFHPLLASEWHLPRSHVFVATFLFSTLECKYAHESKAFVFFMVSFLMRSRQHWLNGYKGTADES